MAATSAALAPTLDSHTRAPAAVANCTHADRAVTAAVAFHLAGAPAVHCSVPHAVDTCMPAVRAAPATSPTRAVQPLPPRVNAHFTRMRSEGFWHAIEPARRAVTAARPDLEYLRRSREGAAPCVRPAPRCAGALQGCTRGWRRLSPRRSPAPPVARSRGPATCLGRAGPPRGKTAHPPASRRGGRRRRSCR